MAKIKDKVARVKNKLTKPEPISNKHNVTKFDCGNEDLNHWLRQRALKNESRFTRTYVVCDNHEVVAF